MHATKYPDQKLILSKYGISILNLKSENFAQKDHKETFMTIVHTP